MHKYIEGGPCQPTIINEGALKNPAHLQGYEANTAFSAVTTNTTAAIPSQVQFPIETTARSQLAQIRPLETAGTENDESQEKPY